MKHITPNEMNALLGTVITSNKIELLNIEELVKEGTVGVNFWDFLRSQLNRKIIKSDFSHLLTTVVGLNNLQNGIVRPEYSEKLYGSLSTLFTEYVDLVGTISIYLHLAHSIKIRFSMPKIVNCMSYNLDDSDKIFIFKDFPEITDLDVYKDIILDKELFILSVGSIDYKYLSCQLAYLNYVKSGVCAVWEGDIC